MRLFRHFHSILLKEFVQPMTIVLCYVFQIKIKKVATSQDFRYLSIGGNSHIRKNQFMITTLQQLRFHHSIQQVFCIL